MLRAYYFIISLISASVQSDKQSLEAELSEAISQHAAATEQLETQHQAFVEEERQKIEEIHQKHTQKGAKMETWYIWYPWYIWN